MKTTSSPTLSLTATAHRPSPRRRLPKDRAVAWIGACLVAAGLSLASAEALAARSLVDDLPTIDAVEISGTDTTLVNLRLSRTIEGAAISSYFLSDPERLVIDVADAALGDDPVAVSGRSPLIDRVTTEETEDAAGTVLHVTLYVKGTVDREVSVDGDKVLVHVSRSTGKAEDPLAAAPPASDTNPSTDATATSGYSGSGRPLSGPHLAADAPPMVSTLDFESLDDVSRVVIGTNGPLEFTTTQAEANLVVIDIPNAGLAPSLERPLDASQFVSPVRSVRAYRTRNGTRIAVNLRRATDFQARRVSDGLVFVDFTVPEDMRAERVAARQSFTGAAPSTPQNTQGDGLKSAYQQELLIGSSGRTMNPQAVFGQGSGISDPSSTLGMAAGFMFDTYSASDLPYTGQRINVDLVNADIHSVFRLISSVSKLNIVAGDDVTGRVTVRLENVPWDQAFAAVLQAKGLGSQRFGNIVRIAPIETIKMEQQAALEAKRASDELQELKVYVVPLNYAQASDLETQIATMLTKRGSLKVDSRSNQLIIQDTEDSLAKVRELVRQLDKQTPQVLIEARVVEATSNFSRGLGIQWGGELNASPATGFGTGLFFPSTIGATGGTNEFGQAAKAQWYESGVDNVLADLGSPIAENSSIALNLGSLTGLVNLDARLTAAETEGWGKIVSSPRVITLDNEEAYIKQGARIPYPSTSAGGTQVQFVQAALELTVTPHITSDNRIFLDIEVKNDRPDFSQQVQGQPSIQIKEAKTALLVSNGETTVIGGVYSTERSFSQSRIPFLSKIPILGYLFKNSGNKLSRNELLVFITPRILTQPVAAK